MWISDYICPICVSILLIFGIGIIYALYAELKDARASLGALSDFSKRDYDKDFKFLNKLIDEEIDYTKKVVFPTLEGQKSGKIYNDTDYKNILNSNLESIKSNLSEEYIDLMNFYVSDLDVYILRRLKFEYEPLISKINKAKLKGNFDGLM